MARPNLPTNRTTRNSDQEHADDHNTLHQIANLLDLSTPTVLRGTLVFNVKDYGAVGDGVADDSAAIRSALASGGVVWVPPGTFKISQDGSNAWCLSVPTDAIITGPGTLKMANSQAVAVRMLRVAADNVTLDGITLDMNRANQSVEGNPQRHAIYCTGDGLRVVNCDISGPTGDAILFDTGSENALIQGNRITNCERNGVTFYGNSAGVRVNNDIRVIGNHIEATVQPVDSEPSNGHVDNIHIHGNYLWSTGNDYALTCGAVVGEFNQGWSVIGNTLVGALYCVGLGASTIAGNTIDATATSGNAVTGQYNSLAVSFTDNKVYGATNQNCMLLELVGANRPSGWMIKGNTFNVLGTGLGIYARGAGPVTITSNHFYGVNSAYGIHCQATGNMESVVIHHNYLDGFATAIYAAPFSTFTFNKLSITHNHISNTQGTPTATYGVRLTGTAAQFTRAVVTGNIVDATVYTTSEDMSTVIVRISGTDRVGHWSCTGTPEAQVTARIGSTCSRRDGGAATSFYVKESGTGNTGWVAK